jgi:hypothetical protein
LQRDKVVLTTIAAYVAIVVTGALTNPILQFFSGERPIMNQVFIRGINNPFIIQTAIFAIVVAIVTTKSGLDEKGSNGILSPIELLGYSILNTALIMTTVFGFMPEETRNGFSSTSKLANILITHNLWWILLPIALLIVLGMKKGD